MLDDALNDYKDAPQRYVLDYVQKEDLRFLFSLNLLVLLISTRFEC